MSTVLSYIVPTPPSSLSSHPQCIFYMREDYTLTTFLCMRILMHAYMQDPQRSVDLLPPSCMHTCMSVCVFVYKISTPSSYHNVHGTLLHRSNPTFLLVLPSPMYFLYEGRLYPHYVLMLHEDPQRSVDLFPKVLSSHHQGTLYRREEYSPTLNRLFPHFPTVQNP